MKNLILSPAPIVKNSMIENFCGKNNLFIKDCSRLRTSGGFSSGTFKDYRSCQLANDFGKKNPILYSIVYTTAGYSLGMIAKEYNQLNGFYKSNKNGIVVVNVIDEDLDEMIKRILRTCSVTIELPLSKKVFSRAEIRKIVYKKTGQLDRNYIDAENYVNSYSQLAREIIAESPGVVFMPLGGGEALYSLLNLLESYTATKKNIPKIIATTIRANVFASGATINNSSIADKLVTPHSELLPIITQKINKFGDIVTVEEDNIMPAYLALKEAGLRAEFSAAVPFAAVKKSVLNHNEKILIVNSGSGIYFDENNHLHGII